MEEPAKIKKLDEVVVNRIAAGEIIQRPANALKELIENSLDAKCTDIKITVKDGGLKILQIQDNGTGIRKEDMEIVCERFTTSKLEKFDDLKSIATFGFRGEALASISHVALLTITTKTMMEKCGYKASYIDGKLRAPPKPCAANQGTTIFIENLFYNIATRRKALGSPTEEFTKIADVVTRYAIHNPKIGFSLNKHGIIMPIVRTPHESTKLNDIKLLYGNELARELIEIESVDVTYKFKTHAIITNPNYTNKRMTLILFINHRLVESSPIRRMVEELYSFYLPKKTHPWCYISLEINPNAVDVNVHPTKHEVRFLHEDAIIERIRTLLDEKLSTNNASRTFHLKARMPQVDIPEAALTEVLPEYDKEKDNKTKKINPNEMIRSNSSDQKLDKFNFMVERPKDRPKASCDVKNEQQNNDSSDFKEEFNIKHVESSVACALRSPFPKEKIIGLEKAVKNINPERINSSEFGTSESSASGLNLEKSSPESSFNENEYRNAQPSDISLSKDNPTNELSNSEVEFETTQMDVEKTNISLENGKPTIEILSNLESLTDVGELDWGDFVDDPSTGLPSENGSLVPSMNPESTNGEIDKNSTIDPPNTEDESSSEGPMETVPRSKPAENALKVVYKYYGTEANIEPKKTGAEDGKDVEKRKENTSLEKNSGVSSENDETPSKFKCYSVNPFRIQVKLHSILSLRKEMEDNYHRGLREIFSNLIFVGCVDEKFALIQSGLNLYICHTQKLAEEFFYEIMLYDFENFGVFKFSVPLSLEDLALLGLDDERTGWSEEDGTKEEIASRVKELLLEKADLLKDYFSIHIDKRGNLKSLPILLDKYIPYVAELPLYILRLATEVNWTYEKECLAGICRETAKFYSYVHPRDDEKNWKNIIEHILYSAVKESFLPPKHFSHDSTILQIIGLPDLYKVFERC